MNDRLKISVLDGSEYFRGLLLLIRKDRRITEAETILMKRIGKALGLASDFCDDAIRELLDNEFIVRDPPRFSRRELALKFIRDGLTLASADDEMHSAEETWLLGIAGQCGIDAETFAREKESALRRRKDLDLRLEVDDLTVEYSRRAPEGLS
jgi:hypothetical protein